MATHIFKLSEPLKTHDGEVTELKLKAPKARLFIKYADPFKLLPLKDQEGLEFTFNSESMLKFAADMSGVDELILSDLSGSDFMRLRQEIANIILGAVSDKDPSEQSVA